MPVFQEEVISITDFDEEDRDFLDYLWSRFGDDYEEAASENEESDDK